MSDQTHYERQPDVLPLTLPAGTRSTCGSVATVELQLRKASLFDGACAYWGRWDDDGPHVGLSYFRAHAIDWTSVPLPATPEPADRPIQAGDWVECIEHWVHSSPPQGIGDRFEVTHLGALGSLCFAEYPCVAWLVERFKRVDGQHAETATPLEKTVRAQLYGVDPGHSERGVVSRVTIAGGKIVAVEPIQSSGAGEARKCESCGAGAPIGMRFCTYCPGRAEGDICALNDEDFEARNEAARERMAGMDRSERPRVTNRAERKQLAAGHPSGWPSNEGED
jgi:hypothetical protein